MYAPLNRWKIRPEGEKVLDKIDKMVKSPLYKNSKIRKIKLKSIEFDAILEGMSPSYRFYCKDEIPDVMGFTLVRIK